MADWSAVAEDPTIDAVSIVVGNALHRPIAEALVAAGKHVPCEKPLAGSREDARAMAELERTADVVTAVGRRRRRTRRHLLDRVPARPRRDRPGHGRAQRTRGRRLLPDRGTGAGRQEPSGPRDRPVAPPHRTAPRPPTRRGATDCPSSPGQLRAGLTRNPVSATRAPAPALPVRDGPRWCGAPA
ncbi:Gfo/Idh/MocA family oxidoreductase [Streptomyces sp. NPDC096311]|uniref:Gfo/Idh/MocA family protein n=1 Tax=Streptomyces sp. NPDC096311 TaxID=3366083 RepID=UPI003816D17E